MSAPSVRCPSPRRSPESDHTCTRDPDWTFGLRAGDSDRNEELRAECPACVAETELAGAVVAWEDRPFDPRDDLSLLAAAGIGRAELDRLRAAQREITADPHYLVVDRLGGALRAAWLAECIAAGPRLDVTAAEDFHAERVCRCALAGQREQDDGSPVYGRHREADRCAPCRVLDALAERAHASVLASAGVGRQTTRPMPVDPQARARRLRELLDEDQP